MFRSTIFICTALLAQTVSASDIAGLWKNSNNPVWMEIAVSDDGFANGTIIRNEHNPDAVNRVILKALVADRAVDDLWRGQVFAPRLGEFRDAEVRVANDQRLEITVKVGFISRTVAWTRQVAQGSADE